MPEIHLKKDSALGKPSFTNTAFGKLTKTNKEYKKLNKKDIHDTFFKN